jgi:putative spermidine/putrescine transport system permease protein
LRKDPSGCHWRRTTATAALLAPALLYLALAFYYPLGTVLSLSVVDPHPTLRHYSRIVSEPAYGDLLWTTAKIAVWTTVACIVMGYPVAYFLSTLQGRAYRIALFLVIVPLWTSGLVRSYAWLVILGRNGLVNDALLMLGVVVQPVRLVHNAEGMYVGLIQILLPYAILPMHATMRNLDTTLVRASRSLGASQLVGFLSVYLPLSLGGVFAGALLVFILAFGSFVIPSLLGGLRETMIAVYIQTEIGERLNWGFGAALAVVMLLTVGLAGGVMWRLGDPVRSLGAGAPAITRGARPRTGRGSGRTALGSALGWVNRGVQRLAPTTSGRRLRVGDRGLRLLVGGVFGYLVLPALVLVPMSFSATDYLTFPPRGFSLRHYRTFAEDPRWLGGAWLSLTVAAIVVVLALALGTAAAYALVRRRPAGSGILYLALVLPSIIPPIAYAVGYYYLATRIGLVGSGMGLVLAHVALALPFVVVTTTAAIAGVDANLERASLSLGASPLKTFRHVLWPLILPGLFASGLFAFLVSFDELIVALFVTGRQTTLPKLIWDGVRIELNPVVAAVSSLQIVLSGLIVVSAELLRRRTTTAPPSRAR